MVLSFSCLISCRVTIVKSQWKVVMDKFLLGSPLMAISMACTNQCPGRFLGIMVKT